MVSRRPSVAPVSATVRRTVLSESWQLVPRETILVRDTCLIKNIPRKHCRHNEKIRVIHVQRSLLLMLLWLFVLFVFFSSCRLLFTTGGLYFRSSCAIRWWWFVCSHGYLNITTPTNWRLKDALSWKTFFLRSQSYLPGLEWRSIKYGKEQLAALVSLTMKMMMGLECWKTKKQSESYIRLFTFCKPSVSFWSGYSSWSCECLCNDFAWHCLCLAP